MTTNILIPLAYYMFVMLCVARGERKSREAQAHRDRITLAKLIEGRNAEIDKLRRELEKRTPTENDGETKERICETIHSCAYTLSSMKTEEG